MKTLIILLCLFSTSLSYGVEVLSEGQKAPYKGVLFTMKEEAKVRVIREQKLKLEDLRIAQDTKITIQTERIKLLREHIEDTSLGFLGKTGWFFVGFFTGGIVMYYATKAAKGL